MFSTRFNLVQKKFRILVFFLFLSSFYLSQVSITTSNYSQNFGTSAVPTWSNNSTFLGWYLNDVTNDFNGNLNITAAAPTNTGGIYIYTCSGGTDRKLGSRASNGTGIIHYGLRIINNTGSTINSITVTYTAFQLSLAENNSNVNTNTFSYRVVNSPTTITDLTSGAYTNVASLNYTAPNSHGGPGTSNQVSGIPCTSSSLITACVPVVIQNNGEIMLRWTDIDNGANDHHLALDNVQVLFHFNNDCSITLPIELIDFIGYHTNGINRLEWSVASERDNDYYVIEKSLDGLKWDIITQIDGYGTTNSQQDYYTYDNNVETDLNYYKLSQVDFNGSKTELKIIAIDNKNKILDIIKITNIIGQEVNNEYVGIKLFHMSNGEIIKKY